MDWSYEAGMRQYGMATPLTIDATVRTTAESRELQGTRLWKMNLFGSRSADGSGQRLPQRTQVLDGYNQAIGMPAGGPVQFTDVSTSFPMEQLGCGEFKYLCMEFTQGDSPDPQYAFRTSGSGDTIVSCKSADCGGGCYQRHH